jgi:hypothetical protein
VVLTRRHGQGSTFENVVAGSDENRRNEEEGGRNCHFWIKNGQIFFHFFDFCFLLVVADIETAEPSILS